MPKRQSSAEFQVVFVCTGNRFRSPLAAELFRTRTASLPVSVRSAGTLELGPVPALAEAVDYGARLGVDLSSHRARCLLGDDLSRVDLVVGFERLHLATAVVDTHAKTERVFTLPELVELLEAADGNRAPGEALERARLVVAKADALRRSAGSPAGSLEIEDPLGAPPKVASRTAEAIGSLTERLILGLFGVVPSGAPSERGTR